MLSKGRIDNERSRETLYKAQLYDLEFFLAESFAVGTAALTNSKRNNSSNRDGGNDVERRNQVMDSIQDEIQELKKQKMKMEREIPIKYKTDINENDNAKEV